MYFRYLALIHETLKYYKVDNSKRKKKSVNNPFIKSNINNNECGNRDQHIQPTHPNKNDAFVINFVGSY